MSNSPQNDARTQALLELVERDRESRVRAVSEAARDEADRMVRAARADAHQLVRQAIADNRQRMARRMDEARADLATKARLRENETNLILLSEAWLALEKELAARWSQPATRSHWVRSLLERAAQVLPPGPLVVDHPPAFTLAEFERTRKSDPPLLATRAIELRRAPIEAGLRISCDGVTVDGTIAGLRSASDELRGRLMAALVLEDADDAATSASTKRRGAK